MVTVGIIGAFQQGKSTLLNCLLNEVVAQTGGQGVSVTSCNTVYSYGKGEERVEEGTVYKQVKASFLKDYNLIDTPGFNANAHDTQTAQAALDMVDMVLFVIHNKGISEQEIEMLHKIQSRGIPYIVIMNCLKMGGQSTWDPTSDFNHNIAESNAARLATESLMPIVVDGQTITPVNIVWHWYASGLYKKDASPVNEDLLDMINLYIEKKLTKSSQTITERLMAWVGFGPNIKISDGRLDSVVLHLQSPSFKKRRDLYEQRKNIIAEFQNNCRWIVQKKQRIQRTSVHSL